MPWFIFSSDWSVFIWLINLSKSLSQYTRSGINFNNAQHAQYICNCRAIMTVPTHHSKLRQTLLHTQYICQVYILEHYINVTLSAILHDKIIKHCNFPCWGKMSSMICLSHYSIMTQSPILNWWSFACFMPSLCNRNFISFASLQALLRMDTNSVL